jgi:hypothetical protein
MHLMVVYLDGQYLDDHGHKNVCHERLHTTRMGGNNECGKTHSKEMEHNWRDKLGYAIQFEDVTSANTIIEVVPLQHL